MEQEVAADAGAGRVVVARDRRVQVFEGGAGAPLLWLHGAGVPRWRPVHDLLARRRRVLMPVHPGFGGTDGYEAMEDMEDLVFHTLDVMDALGLARVDVAGLSLGGWLAAELALRRPDRVGRLVLADAAGVRLPGVPTENIFMAAPPRARELMFFEPGSAVARDVVPDAPAPDALAIALRAREAAARLLWHPHREHRKLTERLPRIAAETLVVWGAEDRLLPLAHGEAYARAIPGARLVVVERCGHLPPDERPERFAEAVLDFLEARA